MCSLFFSMEVLVRARRHELHSDATICVLTLDGLSERGRTTLKKLRYSKLCKGDNNFSMMEMIKIVEAMPDALQYVHC